MLAPPRSACGPPSTTTFSAGTPARSPARRASSSEIRTDAGRTPTPRDGRASLSSRGRSTRRARAPRGRTRGVPTE
jgi:hypothetical protein